MRDFTDLDGTLLDHSTYSFAEAQPHSISCEAEVFRWSTVPAGRAATLNCGVDCSATPSRAQREAAAGLQPSPASPQFLSNLTCPRDRTTRLQSLESSGGDKGGRMIRDQEKRLKRTLEAKRGVLVREIDKHRERLAIDPASDPVDRLRRYRSQFASSSQKAPEAVWDSIESGEDMASYDVAEPDQDFVEQFGQAVGLHYERTSRYTPRRKSKAVIDDDGNWIPLHRKTISIESGSVSLRQGKKANESLEENGANGSQTIQVLNLGAMRT